MCDTTKTSFFKKISSQPKYDLNYIYDGYITRKLGTIFLLCKGIIKLCIKKKKLF